MIQLNFGFSDHSLSHFIVSENINITKSRFSNYLKYLFGYSVCVCVCCVCGVWVWVWVWVCVCVCVCACVCLFISFHRKDFSWMNKTINVVSQVQASDGMLRKYFCVKYLCRHVIDNHSRNLQASNCAKECQLNREEPREAKDNS